MRTRRIRRALGIILVVGLVLTCIGCPTKVTIYGVRPAEISLGKIKTLAVLKFSGKYGEMVRSDFYSKLDEVKHFNLIDTTSINKLDKVRYDQIDDPRFLTAYRDIHADGVITGRVTASVKDRKGRDQVQMQEGTGRYKKGKDIFGNTVDVEIMKTVLRPVPYVIRQASVTCHFKVFDLSTRRILATSKVTKSFKEKFGGERENQMFGGRKLAELPSKSETANDLSREVSATLVAKIAPTRFTKQVELESGNHERIKRGIEYAKGGSMQEAVEIWREVTKAEPAKPEAFYNLGVAYESYGDLKSLKKAKLYYKKADNIKSKPLYVKSINRINKAIQDRRKLDRQQKDVRSAPTKQSGDTGGVRIY